MFIRVALKSLRYRGAAALLVVMATAVSLAIILGVSHIGKETRSQFTSTLSGTDLLIGPRTSSVNLLLYGIFGVGIPENNLSWKGYEAISEWPEVEWTVPFVLGDSHRGFLVVGTTDKLFERYQYGARHALIFAQGQPFSDSTGIVLGAEVAKQTGYGLHKKVVATHGHSHHGHHHHDEFPFEVTGILEPTGTPIDQKLFVQLEGIDRMHTDWKHGMKIKNAAGYIEKPYTGGVTIALVGLKNRSATFAVQQKVREFKEEPMSAVIPGVALLQLWGIVGDVENALKLISALVFLAALSSMIAMMLASIRERMPEFKTLRSIGASPKFIIGLMVAEAQVLYWVSVLISVALLTLCILALDLMAVMPFGVAISYGFITLESTAVIIGLSVLCLLVSLVPSFRIYRAIQRQ